MVFPVISCGNRMAACAGGQKKPAQCAADDRGGTETYYRFLWMIPVIPMLGYAAVDIIIMQKNMIRKIAAAAVVMAVIALAGVPYI